MSPTEEDNERALRVSQRLDRVLQKWQQQSGTRWVAPVRDSLVACVRCQVVTRIALLEHMLIGNPAARLLIYLGFSPVHLFIVAALGAGLGLRWMYRESRGLLITLLGTVYPTVSTWRLLRQRVAVSETCDTAATAQRWIVSARRWLSYWCVFALLQLVEHWNRPIQNCFAGYHIVKMALLYWLQCPVAWGSARIGDTIRNPPSDSQHRDRPDMTAGQPSQSSQSAANVNSSAAYPPRRKVIYDSWHTENTEEDWPTRKQRLLNELVQRPAWQDPSAAALAQEAPVRQPLNYADAVSGDATFYPPAELLV